MYMHIMHHVHMCTYYTYICVVVFAGDVALIRGGELHCIGASGPYHYNAGDQFGIVSDRYVKWKGGKIPTDAEKSKV